MNNRPSSPSTKKRIRIGVILTFLFVLGGASLLTYVGYAPVLHPDKTPVTTTSTSLSTEYAHAGALREGSGGIGVRDHDDVRRRALQQDQELLSKLKARKQEKRDQAEMSHDPNYSTRDIKERVRQDYGQVEQAKNLSDSMKTDFEKHYKNITLDLGE